MGSVLGQQVLGQPNLNHCRMWQAHRGAGEGALETGRRQGCGYTGNRLGAEPWNRALRMADMSLLARALCSLLHIKSFQQSLSGLWAWKSLLHPQLRANHPSPG